MLSESSNLNIICNDGKVSSEDNYVPFENKNINKDLLQSVHNNNILDINSNSNILLASSILSRRRNKKNIKKRVSFHESILNMESKEESDDSPREVRIRHSWHADDVDSEENSNSVANFWAMFSLESNPWSPPDPSEIGQEVLVEDNMHDVTARSTKLTSNIQSFFDSFPKMSETNININKEQILSRVDKVFESIKTKIEPCAEGEIPMERRSFYWPSESDLMSRDLMSREACEVGRLSSPQVKRQSVVTLNATSTPNQWPQSKVCPKAMLVKKFLKSIPPVKKRPKHTAPVLKYSVENFKFKVSNISKEMKQNAVHNFHEELDKLSILREKDRCQCNVEVTLTRNLEAKFNEILNSTKDDYIFKVYKVLNELGDPELLFITKKRLILLNVDTGNQSDLCLRNLNHVFVSEQTVTFECKGATNRNLTVICCIDVGFASTLISNVEIICLKQRLAPSSVSAKPKEKLVSLLKRLSKQTQYFKVCDEVVLLSWSWIEQFSDISKTGLDEIKRSGNLMYKINDKSPWTPGFIFLNDGVLTVKESPSSLKNISVIQCHSFCQVNDSSRPYTFKVHFNPYSFILFAASDESQLFDWLQNIMISIKINDNRNHMIPSPTPEEKVTGNYLLVSSSHIICYKHPHRVDLVVPLQQVSSFKLSKTCDYCVMELNCLEASEDELLNDVAFHFISKSQLEQFTDALLNLRHFKVSDELLLHEQMLNRTNKKLKLQWDKYLSGSDI